MELLGHLLFNDWSHTTIDDIASYQDKIRVLSINHINPAGQLLASVVIADMQIASHHNFILLGKRFGRFQLKLYAYLIIIMQIAIEEQAEHQHKDSDGSISVMKKERLWHQMDQTSKIEHQENHHQIQQYEERRCANLVSTLCHPKRHTIEHTTEV